MTFGRPLAIPEEYIKLPLPVFIDNAPASGHASSDQTTVDRISVLFFNASMYVHTRNFSHPLAKRYRALYGITARVIGSLYGSNLGCNDVVSEKKVVTRILAYGQDLDDWTRDLPPEMSLISSTTALPLSDSHPLTRRLRVVTTLRYLNLQVFLRRPALVKYIDQRPEPCPGSHAQDSTAQLQAAHIQTCFTCANEIITIVHSIVSQGVEAKRCLGAWWFSLYYGKYHPD